MPRGGRPAAAEGDDPTQPGELRSAVHGSNIAVHVASDLLAGLLVWTGAGWLADRWLSTDPWLTVIGALVGYCGALLLIWTRMQRDAAWGGGADEQPGAHRPGPHRRPGRLGGRHDGVHRDRRT